MKGLFIADYNPDSIGVKKKVLSQIKNLSMNLDALSAILVVHSKEALKELTLMKIPNLTVVSIDYDNNLPKIMFKRYFRNWQMEYLQFRYYKRLSKKIESEIDRLDGKLNVAYVRYNASFFFLKKLSKQTKLIVEHNTNDLEELRLRKDNYRESVKYFLEKYYSKINLKKVFIGVAVSEELKVKINQRRKNYIKFIWNNPLDASLYKPREVLQTTKENHLAIMIGSFAEWHGLDLLVASILSYKNKEKLTLHFLGNPSKEIKKMFLGINVEYHGMATIEQQREVFNTCLGAIDSLAHFRLGMKVSPSLKSKEYFAHGIPFVSGSILSMEATNNKVANYYKLVNLEQENLNMEELIAFFKNKIENKKHPLEMYQIVEESFNMKKEFKKLMDLCAA